MPSEAKARFVEARQSLDDYLSRAATVQFDEIRVSVRFILDTIIYGGLAHTNHKKEKIFQSWMGSGISGFIWAEFLAAMRAMMRHFSYFKFLNQTVLEYVLVKKQNSQPKN
jgi:hypothetical protein